jgi:hypothetical protein
MSIDSDTDVPAKAVPADLADEDSRVGRSAIDTAAIPGWGIDADDENDPTWPMRDRRFDDAPGQHWQSPPAQAENVEVLTSIEYNRRPAVFGSASPPKGLSGALRRVAFRFSESRWTHWLLLMGADRVSVVEGVAEDLGRGHIPNLWAELGLGAAWKYDRKAFIRRTTAAAAAVGVAFVAIRLLRGPRRR